MSSCWRSEPGAPALGAIRSVVGRTILVSGRSFEVIGVMPRGFRGARAPGFVSEFWVPIEPSQSRRMLEDRGRNTFEIVARLGPGVSAGQAHAATLIVGKRLAAEYPEAASRLALSEVFRIDGIAAFRGFTRTLAPLFAFVGLMTIVAGLVLLVGCANIAGLLLGRGAARRREIGVRLALGAGRGRLIRQLLTESLLLALVGAIVGGRPRPLARGLDQPPCQPASVPIEFDLTLDRRMFVYTLALSLLTAVLCGLAPARSATRMSVVPALKLAVGEHDTRPERQRMRHWLVVGQVALSCALLLWAGLFARSLSNAHQVDLGFDPAGIVLAHLQFDDEVTRSGADRAAVGGTADTHQRAPRRSDSGTGKIVPLAFRGREEMPMRTETDPLDQRGRTVLVNRVSPEWFQTLRIPLRAGRDFSGGDGVGAPRVVVVNETLARQFWNGSALGKRLDGAEVVGVVQDSKYWTLGEVSRPTVYTAYHQRPEAEVTVFVHTSDVAGTAKGVRAEIARLYPTMVIDVQPMTDAVGAALVPAQVGAAATIGFGALGALLAMMGIYGLVAFTVAQRTREIGIRKAVGATTSEIVRLVTFGTAVPVAIGLVLGLGAGALGAFALGGFIVGVSPADPLTLAATTVLVLGTTLAASTVPALRAARVDPLSALKTE